MFFKKTNELPVNDFDKALIEKSLLWFENKLGNDYIKSKKTLIPSHCNFKYQNTDSNDAIRYFIEYICNFIEINSTTIEYIIVENDQIIFSEGFTTREDEEVSKDNFMFHKMENGNFLIPIYADSLNDFDMFFIRLTYNLTFLKFYSEDIFTFANGYMINFAMILMGFGLICSNISVRSNQWQGISHHGWRVMRFGFINQRMYGYILALLAEYKEESFWKEHLCSDVLSYFNIAKLFIHRNGGDIAFLQPHGNIEINNDEVFMSKSFYSNGKMRIISHYKNNMYEGMMIFYHKNGNLWSERIYKNNIPYTVVSNYDSEGYAVEKGTLTEGTGTLYIYDANGNLDKIDHFANGKRLENS